MTPITFDGMSFGRQEILDNREVLIELRDAALKQGAFGYSVSLSHAIAILHEVAERMENDTNS